MRSSAQKRFTAVGRVAASPSRAASRSRSSASPSRAGLASPARATPNAAATPIAGAPRTARVRIASATSGHVRHSRYTSSPGRRRWSSSTSRSRCQLTGKKASGGAPTRRSARRRGRGRAAPGGASRAAASSGREARDPHDLRPRGVAADDLDPRRGAAEPLGQERANGLVGGPVGRRRGHPHTQDERPATRRSRPGRRGGEPPRSGGSQEAASPSASACSARRLCVGERVHELLAQLPPEPPEPADLGGELRVLLPGVLHELLGPEVRLAKDQLRLAPGVLLELLGDLLRRDERLLERLLPPLDAPGLLLDRWPAAP